MGKKRSSSPEQQAVKEEPEDAPQAPAHDGLTEMELERLAIIARNRERLLALGIPSLVSELTTVAAAAGKQKQKKKRKAPASSDEEGEEEEGAARAKKRRGEQLQPTRRSRRLQAQEENPQPKKETTEEKFKRELGEFIVSGDCPKCGRTFERGHKAHLTACSGHLPPSPRLEGQRAAPRDDAAKDLSWEDRQDAHKVMEARMKQLHLDGLVDFSHEAAKFAVLGSKGNAYVVTLKGDKQGHTCQCLDYRFRRHHCKHITLVLKNLGIANKHKQWRKAVEERMDELVAQQREREVAEERAPPVPVDTAAEVAHRLL